jgi:curved DNA-binding protein CbpA
LADHYEVLGVAKNAPVDEIRRVYKTLARDRHPDRFTDPAEKAKAQEFFQALTEAFNTLSNEQRRRAYDAEQSKPKIEKPGDIAKDAFARALEAVKRHEDQEAVDLLHVAIHHQPREHQYHAVLARILSRHPKHARDAVAALEKAAQLSPTTLAYNVELAGMLNAQGLKIRAKKALEAALKLAPKDQAVLELAAELGMLEKQEPAPGAPAKTGMATLRGFFGKKS